MNAVQLERLQESLQRLRMFKSRERVEALLQEATAEELGYADFLDRLLSVTCRSIRPEPTSSSS